MDRSGALVFLIFWRAENMLAAMFGLKARQEMLHLVGQPLISGMHAGPHGVAAAIGQYLGIEDRPHIGLLIAGNIRMPGGGCILFLRVGMQRQDFRMPLNARCDRMHMQCSEAPPEILVLIGRQMLIAEEDHLIFNQRVMDLLKCLIADILGQVDAADHRAKRGIELAYLYCFVGHDFPPASFQPALSLC